MGGSSSSQQAAPAPYEAPNSLISISNIRILDLLCEGIISGFALKSGIYGNDPLCSTYYDEVVVRNLDGSYNFNVSGEGYFFDYTLGSQAQGVLGNFQTVENAIPLGSNTRIANPPVGAGGIKYVIAGFNTATYPDANSIKVTVRVPTLATSDNNGNVNGYEIRYAVDISLNNGSFVQQEEVTIRGKCTYPYIKESVYVLPKTDPAQSNYDYKIRVRRTTQNILSTKTSNEIFVESITVLSTNSFNYPNSVLVATEISAEQFAAVPFRAYEIQGLLLNVPNGYVPTTYHPDGTITAAQYPVTWDGTWNATKRWSDNPAWVFYDIVTNKRYGLGQYFSANAIDKWALYEISQYCDELVSDGEGGQEPRFTCNTVISERQDAYNLLQNLVSVFRGMVYWGNGLVFATQTNDKKSVFPYTNANVIEGRFSYSDTSTNVRSTVAMVKWTDPENLYRESVEYIEDRDGIARYGYIVKELTAFACTSRGQAYRIGNWILQTERLLTETVTFQVGLDGLYVRPGDVFDVYDNFRNNKQQGGRITKFNALRNEITLDRDFAFDGTLAYTLTCVIPAGSDLTGVTSSAQMSGIRPQQIQTKRIAAASGGQGHNAVVVTDSAFNTNLHEGAVWLISISGTGSIFARSTPYKCLATSEPSPGIIEILGLQYDTGINGITEQSYTTITNPVNSGDQSTIDPPSDLLLQIVTGVYSNNTFFRYIQLDWTPSPSSNLSAYIVSGQEFGGAYAVVGNPISPTLNYNVSVTGLHRFVVMARSVGGSNSTPITGGIVIPSTNPFGNPPTLSGIEIIEKFDSNYMNGTEYTGYYDTDPTFRWTVPRDTNGNQVIEAQFISGYKVFIQRASDGFSYLTNPINFPGITNTTYTLPKNFLITGLLSGAHRDFRFFVQVLDTFGNAVNGDDLDVNNPAPRAPIASGFYAMRGGCNYSIVPNDIDTDISGIYLWFNTGASFVPTFQNASIKTTNLAGLAQNPFLENYFTWFSIIDSFGISGCPIYGPVQTVATVGITSGEADLMIVAASGAIMAQMAAQISGASGVLAAAIAAISGGGAGGSGIGTKTFAQWTAKQGDPYLTAFPTYYVRNNIPCLEYNGTNAQTAFFMGMIPEGHNISGGMNVYMKWMAAAETGTVTAWVCSMSNADNHDLDTDSFVSGDVVFSTGNGICGKTTTALFTFSGQQLTGFSYNSLFRIGLQRVATHVADTTTGAAQLITLMAQQA